MTDYIDRQDDTINRQTAIDALEREKIYSTAYKDGYTQTDYFKLYNMGLADGIKALNKLPPTQSEQKWVLVKERLPEENSDVLVTYVEKNHKRIAPVNYGCGAWFDCFYDMVLNPFGVLAWMPLPEPYEEGEEE